MTTFRAAVVPGVQENENARYRVASSAAPKLRAAICAHFAKRLHKPFGPNLARALITKLFRNLHRRARQIAVPKRSNFLSTQCKPGKSLSGLPRETLVRPHGVVSFLRLMKMAGLTTFFVLPLPGGINDER